MTFPGPYARIYRNEAGEVLGWDNEYPEEPEYDDRDDAPEWCEDCGEPAEDCACDPEEDPDQPIDGQPVESITPDPDIL